MGHVEGYRLSGFRGLSGGEDAGGLQGLFWGTGGEAGEGGQTARYISSFPAVAFGDEGDGLQGLVLVAADGEVLCQSEVEVVSVEEHGDAPGQGEGVFDAVVPAEGEGQVLFEVVGGRDVVDPVCSGERAVQVTGFQIPLGNGGVDKVSVFRQSQGFCGFEGGVRVSVSGPDLGDARPDVFAWVRLVFAELLPEAGGAFVVAGFGEDDRELVVAVPEVKGALQGLVDVAAFDFEADDGRKVDAAVVVGQVGGGDAGPAPGVVLAPFRGDAASDVVLPGLSFGLLGFLPGFFFELPFGAGRAVDEVAVAVVADGGVGREFEGDVGARVVADDTVETIEDFPVVGE